MRSELKAVLFDLDGVIVDTAKYHYLAWKKLADIEGIYFDEKINERLKGVSRDASLEIILERSKKEYSPEEKEKMTETKNNWYLEMIGQLNPEEVLPGVIDFLRSLQGYGVKSAICSASKSAEFIIAKLGLTDYFDTIVGGNHVSKSKPDPEVFLLASERLRIHPHDCVVFEDAYAGIEGANRAEMKALGLGNSSILTNADVVYENMKDLTIADVEALFMKGA